MKWEWVGTWFYFLGTRSFDDKTEYWSEEKVNQNILYRQYDFEADG